MPLKPTVTFILYYISLLLTSPSFSLSLDYSTLFLWLPFTSSLPLAYLRMFPILPVSMTFYLCTISNSRMFFVPILTWWIRNTVSVLWKLSFIVLPLFTKICFCKKWIRQDKVLFKLYYQRVTIFTHDKLLPKNESSLNSSKFTTD